MKEISAFEIGLSLNPTDVIANLVKIGKALQENLFRTPEKGKSIFPDLSEVIAGSGRAIVPDIQVNPREVATRLFRIITTIFALENITKRFENAFDRSTDLERIEQLIGAVEFEDIDTNNRIDQIDRLLANPKTPNKDKLLAEQKILEERALALIDFLNNLEVIRDQLVNDTFLGIGRGPERFDFNAASLGPFPPIQITPPEFDFIRLLEEEFQEILNQEIELPGLKFEIEGVEGVKESLLDIDKTATASAMSFDTMSDASIGLIGVVQNLKDDGFQPLNTDLDQTKDSLDQAQTTVGNLNPSLQSLATANQDVANTQGEVNDKVEGSADAFENGAEGAMQFAEETEQASATLDALGVFAADIAANINDAFSDLLFNAIKGDIDSFGDLWEDTLDTMLQAFTQFASTVISNPIRIILEGALSGNFGGGKNRRKSTKCD